MGKIASEVSRPLLAVITASSFLIAAFGSDLVAMQTSGLEALWPGNAIVLAILILAASCRRDIVAIAAGEAVASVIVHIFRGEAIFPTLMMTAANLVESCLPFLLLRRLGLKGGLVDRVDNVFALIVASAVGGVASSTIGAVGLRIGRSVPFWDGWSSWYVSGLLSALVFTPITVIAGEIAFGRRTLALANKSVIEAMALLGLVAAATSYVFFLAPLPLAFIVAPCVLLATLRFRTLGAASSIAIVAAIAACATAAHYGPIAMLAQPGNQVLMLQIFIATTLMSALPVAAILNDRDHQAQEARAFAEHFKSVVENSGEVIFRIDNQGRWAYLNPAWTKLTGHAITASIGKSWLALVDPNACEELADRAGAVLRGEDGAAHRIVRLETPGGLRWVELVVQALRDQDGRVTGATGTLRDIDDRKRLEDHVISAKRRAEQRAREAALLASTDELTGIANRRAFMGQLDREIAGAVEFGWPLAVAMFDVDHFKAVNDRYGHAVGDRVLQRIAARAAGVVRGGDMVGRLGGEEFGILMPGATLQEAALVAERLREAMEASGDSDEALPGVTISVGIATREAQGSAAELLAAADAALYAAKDEGRNRVSIAA